MLSIIDGAAFDSERERASVKKPSEEGFQISSIYVAA
jgi:hypothetical protein